MRFEHPEKLVCELDLSREPVFPGAPNVSEGALDLSPKEAREDDMGVIAERTSIYVTLVCDEIECPNEVTSDNLLVEPVGQPADDGHPPECLQPVVRCTWYSCCPHAREPGGSSPDWIHWHPPRDDAVSTIGSDGGRP